MRKFFTILCLFLVFALGLFAQSNVVFSYDEFQENPPQSLSEQAYESPSFQFEGKDVDRRLMDEGGKMSYAFLKFSNNFDFRPVELNLDVRMGVTTYFTRDGKVQFIVYRFSQYERTEKGVKTVDFEMPKAFENKFRKILEEFAKQYKSTYNSLIPFKVIFGLNLKKEARSKKTSVINSIEEAELTTRPDTVKKLNFSGLELKEVPNVIYRFQNIKEIELSNNYLKSIPKELSKLKNLTYLGLNFNDITNDSVNFYRNRHLKVLRLQHNSLTTLPKNIKKNRRLEDLLLGNNELIEISKANFRGLKRLKTLNLYNSSINELPSKIKHLKNIEVIDLYHNNLRFLPENIIKLKKLSTLAVAHNMLWKLPENIDQMNSLKEMYLHHNKLYSIANLPTSLTLLHIANNKIAEMPINLTQMKNLENFDFSSNIFVTLPTELKELPKLKSVFMMGNEYNRKEEKFEEVDRFVVDLESKNIFVR